MARILVFGDSISYGLWEKEGGWVAKLRKCLEQKKWLNFDYYRIYNLGISGNTTEDLINRFESDTLPRLDLPLTFIFEIGINDSYFLIKENKINVTLEKFENNLKMLIKLSQKYSSKIIFLGLTPVDEKKVNPMPWSPNESYKNENIRKYNQTIKIVCQKNEIYFIELYDNWIKSDYKKWLEDGAHPNSVGHQKIFEIVRDFLVDKELV